MSFSSPAKRRRTETPTAAPVPPVVGNEWRNALDKAFDQMPHNQDAAGRRLVELLVAARSQEVDLWSSAGQPSGGGSAAPRRHRWSTPPRPLLFRCLPYPDVLVRILAQPCCTTAALSVRDATGGTVLHHAAAHPGGVPALRLLLGHPAATDRWVTARTTTTCETAAAVAVRTRQPVALALLLDAVATAEHLASATDVDRGFTALMAAAELRGPSAEAGRAVDVVLANPGCTLPYVLATTREGRYTVLSQLVLQAEATAIPVARKVLQRVRTLAPATTADRHVVGALCAPTGRNVSALAMALRRDKARLAEVLWSAVQDREGAYALLIQTHYNKKFTLLHLALIFCVRAVQPLLRWAARLLSAAHLREVLLQASVSLRRPSTALALAVVALEEEIYPPEEEEEDENGAPGGSRGERAAGAVPPGRRGKTGRRHRRVAADDDALDVLAHTRPRRPGRSDSSDNDTETLDVGNLVVLLRELARVNALEAALDARDPDRAVVYDALVVARPVALALVLQAMLFYLPRVWVKLLQQVVDPITGDTFAMQAAADNLAAFDLLLRTVRHHRPTAAAQMVEFTNFRGENALMMLVRCHEPARLPPGMQRTDWPTVAEPSWWRPAMRCVVDLMEDTRAVRPAVFLQRNAEGANLLMLAVVHAPALVPTLLRSPVCDETYLLARSGKGFTAPMLALSAGVPPAALAALLRHPSCTPRVLAALREDKVNIVAHAAFASTDALRILLPYCDDVEILASAEAKSNAFHVVLLSKDSLRETNTRLLLLLDHLTGCLRRRFCRRVASEVCGDTDGEAMAKDDDPREGESESEFVARRCAVLLARTDGQGFTPYMRAVLRTQDTRALLLRTLLDHASCTLAALAVRSGIAGPTVFHLAATCPTSHLATLLRAPCLQAQASSPRPPLPPAAANRPRYAERAGSDSSVTSESDSSTDDENGAVTGAPEDLSETDEEPELLVSSRSDEATDGRPAFMEPGPAATTLDPLLPETLRFCPAAEALLAETDCHKKTFLHAAVAATDPPRRLGAVIGRLPLGLLKKLFETVDEASATILSLAAQSPSTLCLLAVLEAHERCDCLISKLRNRVAFPLIRALDAKLAALDNLRTLLEAAAAASPDLVEELFCLRALDSQETVLQAAVRTGNVLCARFLLNDPLLRSKGLAAQALADPDLLGRNLLGAALAARVSPETRFKMVGELLRHPDMRPEFALQDAAPIAPDLVSERTRRTLWQLQLSPLATSLFRGEVSLVNSLLQYLLGSVTTAYTARLAPADVRSLVLAALVFHIRQQMLVAHREITPRSHLGWCVSLAVWHHLLFGMRAPAAVGGPPAASVPVVAPPSVRASTDGVAHAAAAAAAAEAVGLRDFSATAVSSTSAAAAPRLFPHQVLVEELPDTWRSWMQTTVVDPGAAPPSATPVTVAATLEDPALLSLFLAATLYGLPTRPLAHVRGHLLATVCALAKANQRRHRETGLEAAVCRSWRTLHQDGELGQLWRSPRYGMGRLQGRFSVVPPPPPPAVPPMAQEEPPVGSGDCLLCSTEFATTAEVVVGTCGHSVCLGCAGQIHECPFCRGLLQPSCEGAVVSAE